MFCCCVLSIRLNWNRTDILAPWAFSYLKQTVFCLVSMYNRLFTMFFYFFLENTMRETVHALKLLIHIVSWYDELLCTLNMRFLSKYSRELDLLQINHLYNMKKVNCVKIWKWAVIIWFWILKFIIFISAKEWRSEVVKSNGFEQSTLHRNPGCVFPIKIYKLISLRYTLNVRNEVYSTQKYLVCIHVLKRNHVL